MLIELGNYEPFGKSFLDNRPYIGQKRNDDPIIDFSCFNSNSITNASLEAHSTKSFHNVFSISETMTINVGDELNERNLNHLGKIENPAVKSEQEIYVRGSVVVWSRAGYVVKAFNYSDEDQLIQQVLFAWFPISSLEDNSTKNTASADNQNAAKGYWDKKGPHSRMNTREEDDEGENNGNYTTGAGNTLKYKQHDYLQQRALCIVFQNFIKIHTENGHSATSYIPFEIGDAISLDVGLLVSRKHMVDANKNKKSKNNKHMPANSSTSQAPAGPKAKQPSVNSASGSEFSSFFITVTHPLRGACPVKTKDVSNTSISSLPEPLTDPQKLLFATTKSSETGRLPVIVTLNIKEHRHYIWTYERRKEKKHVHVANPTSSAAAVASPLHIKRKPATNPAIPKRKYSKANPPTTPSRNPPVTPNRNKKQKPSRINSPPKPLAQFHEDYVSDDEILHENDLEKDIYHELLDPSEISLRLLWRETHKLPIKSKGKDIESRAFLVHDLNGQELICIMNYTAGNLQLINLSKATHLLNNCIEFKTTAKAAIPITATREGFNDMLYTDSSGALQLFVDPLIPKQHIKLAKLTNAVITEIVDPVFDLFSVVLDNKQMFRYQLKFRPESSLVRDCLAAIDCATTFYFPKIWYRFLETSYFDPLSNDCNRIKMTEWQAFFVSLLSFLPLKKKWNYHTGNNNKRDNKRLPVASLKNIQLQQIKASNTKFITTELGFLSAPSLQNYTFLLDENYMEGVPAKWIDQIVSFEKDTSLELTSFCDIINSLHVVYEDYRIRKPMTIHATLLGYLLMQCSVILDNQEWTEYYKSHGIDPTFVGNLQLDENDMRETFIEPPNIQICLRQMTPNTSANPTLLSSFGVNTMEPCLSHCRNTYAQCIKTLWSLYGAINHISSDRSILIERMIANQTSREMIESMHESVSLPILEVLDDLKENPPSNWTKEAYMVIGRDDMYKQLQMKATVCDPNTNTFKLPFKKDSDHPPSMSDLMKGYSATPVNKSLYESDILNMETERLRFGCGGFIEKVRTMLDASRVPEHVVPEQPGLGDEELTNEHQAQVFLLIQRTLSLSVGRAIYAFGTHVPNLTKVLPLEPITLSAKILPLRTVVTVNETVWSNDSMPWPQFHNGVAAGLRISPSNTVDDSWIDFCSPTDLEPQHGGILLAMGLNGVLKRLSLVDWYRFMTQTCELISIGFIMGAATAYRGTKDMKVTKVLSVHIPALLPPESASFSHSNLIQATSLLGMGIVYMSSCDRLMASVMLREISKNAYTDPSTLEPNYEGCSLAAGFSLGFITLGLGDSAAHLVDLQLRTKLYSLMTGRSAVALSERGKQEEPAGMINLDVTSPGATMALGLMYLKTENSRVAEGVDILETRPYLNYVRPDFLLIRVVAKNLIMWSTIQPNDEWIDKQVPDFIMASGTQSGHHQLMEKDVSKQAMYNIICGACLCIGLRYAGSKNEEAYNCLLGRLDAFIKLLNVQVTTPQQNITKSVIRTCVDVLTTSAAMVMAGTGNRDLLSRLEQLYNRVSDDMSYGNHMAVSMSMGMLFMGLGGYTLTTTNEAIAGLLCAFYPFYPMATDDNRYHLQAFRHLWVLAVDSRWLMPFDVDNKKPCRVPMKLEIYEDDGVTMHHLQRKVRQVRIEAPTVVPDYKLIKSIRLDGKRYWPLNIDMLNGRYQESIIKSGLIYVKKREGEQSYENDPYGQRRQRLVQ